DFHVTGVQTCALPIFLLGFPVTHFLPEIQAFFPCYDASRSIGFRETSGCYRNAKKQIFFHMPVVMDTGKHASGKCVPGPDGTFRSEERRAGKERRSRG